MTHVQTSEGEAGGKPNPLLMILALMRIGYVFDVVLIGTAVGTAIDLAIAPRLLAPENSPIVTNAMLPMIVSLGVMVALTVAYVLLASAMREHPRFDPRRHVRRPLHFQLRLAYHGYLIFAGVGICLWTQIFLWRGHWVIWTFGVALTFVGNLVSQACRYVIMTDGNAVLAEKERKKEPVDPIKIALIVAGLLMAIIGLLRKH
jgi:hypothetical protein